MVFILFLNVSNYCSEKLKIIQMSEKHFVVVGFAYFFVVVTGSYLEIISVIFEK